MTPLCIPRSCRFPGDPSMLLGNCMNILRSKKPDLGRFQNLAFLNLIFIPLLNQFLGIRPRIFAYFENSFFQKVLSLYFKVGKIGRRKSCLLNKKTQSCLVNNENCTQRFNQLESLNKENQSEEIILTSCAASR